MRTTTNAIPGKQGFQPTQKVSPSPLPQPNFEAIKPIQMAMTPKEIYEAFCEASPIFDASDDFTAEICSSCAQKRVDAGLRLELFDLDMYEIQEAYLTGWPCTDCGKWAVEPIGCIYSDRHDSECVASGESIDIVEMKADGRAAWRLGCVNHDHQAARLVEETGYPEEAAKTLVEMTWMAWKTRPVK